MISLLALQQSFHAALRTDKVGADEITASIVAGAFAADQRVGIYRNHHRLSLAAAVTTHYPTVQAVVGDDAFQRLALDYVVAFPPQDPRLACYGDGFADFLAIDKRLQALPYLADVARLDWALIKAQTADDETSFLSSDLAAIGADLAALCFYLHPAATLIRSPYPLLDIRRLAQADDVANAPVDLNIGGSDLLVLRQAGEVTWLRLDRDIAGFLAYLAAGTTLEEAAAGLDESRLPMAIAQYLISGAFAQRR